MALTTINRPDSQKALFGTGDDLELFHDGSDSYLKDTGTGSLYISGSEVKITNAAVSENIAKFIEDGAVELYHNNVKKFETLSDGVKIDGILHWDSGNSGRAVELLDNQKIFLGTGEDLKLYHDGTNSYLENTTGELIIRDDSRVRIRTDELVINSGDNSESIIYAVKDGGVELYYDNTKCFWTKSGASIATAGHLYIEDSKKAFFGNSSDLEISHTSNLSTIKNTHASGLAIRSDIVMLQNDAGDHDYLTTTNEQGVNLFFDNVKKFETKSTGIGIASGQRECNLTLQNDARTWKIVNYDYGDNGTDHLGFHDGSSDRVIIQNTGGISFNGDTATANALDDYEEGTWTPSIKFGGNNSGMSLSEATGNYTKIGHMVYVNAAITVSDKGSSSGAATVTGLPFTNTTSNGDRINGGFTYIAAFNGLTTVPILYSGSSGTTIEIYQADANSGSITQITSVTNAYFNTNNATIRLWAIYRV